MTARYTYTCALVLRKTTRSCCCLQIILKRIIWNYLVASRFYELNFTWKFCRAQIRNQSTIAALSKMLFSVHPYIHAILVENLAWIKLNESHSKKKVTTITEKNLYAKLVFRKYSIELKYTQILCWRFCFHKKEINLIYAAKIVILLPN